MKRKRLDRDVGWGLQGFPYYQFRLETDGFSGLAAYIEILSGETFYWHAEKAGDIPTVGKGMKWLQLVPDGKSRLITALIKPDGRLSVCYIDVIEGVEYDSDGVLAYIDKYLDVVFTPQGDFEVQDRDELDEAYRIGDISKEQFSAAVCEANEISKEILCDIKAASEKLEALHKTVQKMVKNGEVKPLFTKYRKGENQNDRNR